MKEHLIYCGCVIISNMMHLFHIMLSHEYSSTDVVIGVIIIMPNYKHGKISNENRKQPRNNYIYMY